MPYYECVFIARQDISAPQVEALTTAFSDIIVKDGGKVAKVEQWGLRNLAYRIKKNKKGHYVLMNLDAPVAAIDEMERNMGLHEDVLRFMTVKVEALEEGPSAILRRDDRDAPEGRGERPAREGRPHRARREAAPADEAAE